MLSRDSLANQLFGMIKNMKRQKPKIIEEIGFNFNWDAHKIWSLNVPHEDVSIDELAWHFDIPFL